MSDLGSDSSAGLAELLGRFPPFDALEQAALLALARAARTTPYEAGDVILDAFAEPTREMGVVIEGKVAVWLQLDVGSGKADQRLGPGGAFGFSAMLSRALIGPRVIAAGPVQVAWLPEQAVLPAFATPGGVRYLAAEASAVRLRADETPSFSLVEELIVRPPLLVRPDATVAEVARAMTEARTDYAAVDLGGGHYGVITDRLLRERVIAADRAVGVAAAEIADREPSVAVVGDSAAEAMIDLFDREADVVLVLDRAGSLRGAAAPRDFALSPTTAGVTLHEQLRRATTREELVERARRMPSVIADLRARGLTSPKVITVYSAMIDTTVRRAVQLVMAEHPDLDADDFSWMSLGSNGRREVVPSSDIDSAVSFLDRVGAGPEGPERIERYRRAFVTVIDLLAQAGLRSDPQGACANRRVFARTSAEWRSAAQGWLAAPAEHQGAMMTSLLVDGRPIHGDRGLPEVNLVFADLRSHPEAMRLLLAESLSKRARQHSIRDLLARRTDAFDIKTHALLPIVNIARWAALAVGSAELPTVKRLRAASGSTMLPTAQAETLVEVFEVLQHLRLDWQLDQLRNDAPAGDVVSLHEVSPLDRALIAEAVREISAVQRRMDNISAYLPTSEWTAPAIP